MAIKSRIQYSRSNGNKVKNSIQEVMTNKNRLCRFSARECLQTTSFYWQTNSTKRTFSLPLLMPFKNKKNENGTGNDRAERRCRTTKDTSENANLRVCRAFECFRPLSIGGVSILHNNDSIYSNRPKDAEQDLK